MGVMTAAVLATELLTESRTAAPQTSGDTSPNVWLLVTVTLLGSSVVAGVITSVLGNLRTSATARRDGFADAARVLIARSEYPYRVRRRVSDAPEVLEALVSRGHDLQERLAACRTWVISENREVGARFERALAAIDATANPSAADAWTQQPITTAAGMNLEGWGPGDQRPHLNSFEQAIGFRFGWRRLLPTWVWARWHR